MKRSPRHPFLTRALHSLAAFVAIVWLATSPTVLALTQQDIKDINNGSPQFDPTAQDACNTASAAGSPVVSSNLPTGNGATLEGHTLPATSGHVGIEEKAVRVGNSAVLAPGTSAPGAHLALTVNGLTDADVQFYMNMRWRYAVWAWNGGSTSGPENKTWYTSAVRKVLVTNPSNGKTVVASIVESGPAPWTGTHLGANNPPSYWRGYVDGTPPGYTGRVSGLAPDAFHAIGAAEDQSLNYAWDPNQNDTAGKVTQNGQVISAGGATTTPAGPNCPTTQATSTSPGGFIFYSQYDPRWKEHCMLVGQTTCGSPNIGTSGCGPTSVAIVVANFGNTSVTPDQVADYEKSIGGYDPGQGTLWSFLVDGPKHWGLKSTDVGTDLNRAIAGLKAGGLVIASGQGSNPFTSSGHLLVLRGIAADGNILMADPNIASNNAKEWTTSQLVGAGLRQLWVITR